MAEKNVNIDEILGFLDVQDPSGEIKRILPLTLIQGVIGLENLSRTQLAVLILLMKNPYIFGTNESNEPTLYRIEVDKGELYLSDTVDEDPQEGDPNLIAFKEYIDLIKSLFD